MYLKELGCNLLLYFCTKEPQFYLWGVRLESARGKKYYTCPVAGVCMKLLYYFSLYWECLENTFSGVASAL